MEKILPITDLQRQAGQIVKTLSQSDEPVIITQRGRPAAVLISAERYRCIEEDLGRLDQLEMEEMVREARARDSLGQHNKPPRGQTANGQPNSLEAGFQAEGALVDHGGVEQKGLLGVGTPTAFSRMRDDKKGRFLGEVS